MSPHNFKDKSPLMAVDRSTKLQSNKHFFIGEKLEVTFCLIQRT